MIDPALLASGLGVIVQCARTSAAGGAQSPGADAAAYRLDVAVAPR